VLAPNLQDIAETLQALGSPKSIANDDYASFSFNCASSKWSSVVSERLSWVDVRIEHMVMKN